MKTATLRDELATDQVSVWAATGGIQKFSLPAGTCVLVLVPAGLNGYALIQLANDVYEVWHENLSTCHTLN